MLDVSCQLTPYKLEKHIYIRLLRNNLIKTLITKEVRITSYAISIFKQQVSPEDKVWVEGN